MNPKHKELLQDVILAVLDTAKEHFVQYLFGSLILGPISKNISTTIMPQPYKGGMRLASARILTKRAPDGAWLGGPVTSGYAKFAMRKPMPGPGQKRMAVENDPHTVDDFDGIIEEGYGKGEKKLLWTGQAAIKVKGETHIGRVNIHEHDADRAGLHYDFVAEGVAPGTDQFEVNIPNGPFTGRYAFIRPEGFGPDQILITQMKDRGLVIPKPSYTLKTVQFLEELEKSPDQHIVEWKPDGSLANVLIKDNRGIFRSHRESGNTYYDKLPALEDLSNGSPFITNRILFPGPHQNGTVLKGELFHPEGAARVGGILNSLPDKAVDYQVKNGPITFYAWDIVKLRGKDVSHLPYTERRALYKSVINDIQHFNHNWKAVPGVSRGFVSWYDQIVGDRRGLPYSEGVVVKAADSTSSEPWAKVKFRDTMDVRVVDIIEGAGKRSGTVGRLLVETDGGGRGEVGSFKLTDPQLQWIWDNREFLKGQVAEIHAQEVTKAGAPRAGVFIRWHPSKSEAALLMYALDDKEVVYAMKSAAGWRRK